ncbi:MAG: ethanolamine utilization protein EutJ [Deltaproteobacteria bacterium]|jgi:ethanolamine utilization protein EutJ|nr:ethanolamine utilization protein EutJ [Deltaproteobacteria bacterium]
MDEGQTAAPPIPDYEDFLRRLRARLDDPIRPARPEIRVGLDLGTASIVLTVLAADGSPLALAREEASVVRDGLVVDYDGARRICERLRLGLEEKLRLSLDRATIAVPSGTSERDAAAHRHVSEAAGLEVEAVLDEPVAANHLLGIADGALADLGGGTTGAAFFRDGRLVLSFDEPTGGHHLSLVIAGNLKIPLEQAEAIKTDPAQAKRVAPLVAPVLSKMGIILAKGLQGLRVPVLYLAGGTASSPGAGSIIAKETGFPVKLPVHPDLVTPAGIALGCRPYLAGEPSADD